MVQLFTALPSTWIVQAPHWLVSHRQESWLDFVLASLAVDGGRDLVLHTTPP
jgi:hypothetical protein